VTTPGERVSSLSAWINDSYGPEVSGELLLWRRVGKVAEEAGEAHEALIGMFGANARKGVTHDEQDLVDELLDTALTSLAVVAMLRPDGDPYALLDRHVGGVMKRWQREVLEA
jgi:hypothetical protein